MKQSFANKKGNWNVDWTVDWNVDGEVDCRARTVWRARAAAPSRTSGSAIRVSGLGVGGWGLGVGISRVSGFRFAF